MPEQLNGFEVPTETEYLEALAKVGASQAIWAQHAKVGRGGWQSLAPEYVAQCLATNEDQSIVEVYRFAKLTAK